MSLQLQEVTKVAMSKVEKPDDRLHYCFMKIDGFEKEDFANMMHWAVSGHQKLAEQLAVEIRDKTGWEFQSSSIMEYPPDKGLIIPMEKSCCIS